ncbi:MAG: valine--tRNA ligase [Anaerolineae bacterium]|nr:valine--tRNA ligase [Anaerolineae bacterium]
MLPFEKVEDLPKTWQPEEFETSLYDWWEAQGYFLPRIDPGRRPFVIPMPPPNITGALHIGHAITATIEDILIRWHRMMGDPTLWLPGTDHASIATHAVVERELAKEGLTRWDLGRERFEERVWQWREQYGSRITLQHRRLGASCDWTRERFTLDEVCSRAVREAFKRLYDDGLIYRGEYMVNWCPGCGTAVSDLEVIHEEEQGKLWYIRYPLADRPGYIEVATTRPETMLGDTGVAVHPDDERYAELVGATAILPLVERRLPIVADAAVDPAFGTGAVKVTPAHDPTDYEIGLRHRLAVVDVMTPEGKMSAAAGSRYAGMDRFQARETVVADLEREGLISRVEDHVHSVGRCQRCDSPAEPRISLQWFVRTKPLAEPAIAAVREGRVRIIPERFERIYFNWMENIRDWCISRQLWWGHRIPVWYCRGCGETTVAVDDPEACPKCGNADIEQDPDVLDTWFSSGLWPFSTLGWPEDTEDYRYFYPATVLETGYDIIFFWVARMIMMGIAMTGQEPFPYVYLHGLVRDEQGRKYSKSLGNALDPLEVIEEYGTDALRYALVTASTPGNDTKLSVQRIEAGRNFANKIWNAARFVLSNLPPGMEPPDAPERDRLALADRWIISRLESVTASVDRLLRAWQLGEAGRQILDFLWGDYCDWYIEVAKTDLYGEDDRRRRAVADLLVYVLERALRLLHPYMPFVTEAIWQYLPHRGEALIVAPWPEAGAADDEAEVQFGKVMEIVRAIRNVRAEYKVDPGRKIQAVIAAGDQTELLRSQAQIIAALARVDEQTLTIAQAVQPVTQSATVVTPEVTVYLPLAGMVDLAAERERLRREIAETEKELEHARGLLGNPNFTGRAPSHVVERERTREEQAAEKLESLHRRLNDLS